MYNILRPFRSLFYAMATIVLSVACAEESIGDELSASERSSIAASIRNSVLTAYDLSRPNVVSNLMSLYPATGQIFSASGGRVTTTREALRLQITSFWDRVGKNMKNPKWEWTSMNIDVLSPSAAVMTTTYRVPHLTPMGQPHVIGGAWTAVFRLQEGKWVIVQEHLSDSPTP